MAKRTPSISVVIPAYNVGEYLGETIESALSQRVENTEIIVVNDGSTDNTADVMRSFKDRIRPIHQENRGVASARNVGLKSAHGELIAFLDGDDIWHSDNLLIKKAILADNPGLGGVFGDFEIFESTTTIKESGIKHLYSVFVRNGWDVADLFSESSELKVRSGTHVQTYAGKVFGKLFLGNFILTSTLVLRRSVLDEVGLFNVKYATNEDYDFFLRLAKTTSLGFADVPMVRYRRHASQLTNKRNNLRILRAVEQILAGYEDHFKVGCDVRVYMERHAHVLTELAKAELAVGRAQIARHKFAIAMRESGPTVDRVGGVFLSLLPERIRRLVFNHRRGSDR